MFVNVNVSHFHSSQIKDKYIQAELLYKDMLQYSRENIRLGWKWLTVASTLAYSGKKFCIRGSRVVIHKTSNICLSSKRNKFLIISFEFLWLPVVKRNQVRCSTDIIRALYHKKLYLFVFIRHCCSWVYKARLKNFTEPWGLYHETYYGRNLRFP